MTRPSDSVRGRLPSAPFDRRGGNLILGVAESMSWEEIEPFVLSLRQTAFDGDVLLYVADLDASTIDALQSAGVAVQEMRRWCLSGFGKRIFPYDPQLARLHAGYPSVIKAASALSRDTTLMSARLAALVSVRDVRRFFLYYRYLRSWGHVYRNVMLTDVRDVLFQGDPFDFDIGTRLFCFLEDARQTLATQPHNRKWLRTAFGPQIADELGSCPIACAGVTIGSTELVIGYLGVMVRHLLRLRQQAVGLDQAVHNYILHSHRVPAAELVPNGAGVVATLGIVPVEDLEPLLGAAVLHQYDRHAALAASLLGGLRADR